MEDIEEILQRRKSELTPGSIWTFAKQETQFETVFKAACIFSGIKHPDSENIEEYFNSHDYNGFTCNHRMLSSAQLFGLVTKTGNRYGQESVTPVFRELEKYGIGSPEFNTIKTEQLLKIKMSAIIDRADNANTHHIFPVFYIFDVLYTLRQYGINSITLDQLFSYVMTCDASSELEETVEILKTNPGPCEYIEQYKSDCRMWTLIEKNCKIFKVKGNNVSINDNYIDFFYKHFYMNKTNVVESILDSIVEYSDAYKKALATYQNLDIDITDDVPKVDVRFKKKSTIDFKDSLQRIYYGAPGTGKSHEIQELTSEESVVRTTFHPDSDYSTFVGCYKPIMEDVDTHVVPVVVDSGIRLQAPGSFKEKRITYEFEMQAFLKAYLGAWKKLADAGDDNVSPQFLIIEEINRGNCAQIFGDLFQLLDRNEKNFSEYPIESDSDMRRVIEQAFQKGGKYELKNNISIDGMVEDYTSNYGHTLSEDIQAGRVLLLPSNLYIWATMNTSDQSLFPIDSAFKRRWDWKYIPISDAKKNYVIEVDGDQYDWWSFLENINSIIENTTHSEDKKLGYFFAKAKNNVISVDTFVSKVIFYLWNDVFKDNESNHKAFKDDNGNLIAFHKFFHDDGSVNTDSVIKFLQDLGVDPFENTNNGTSPQVNTLPNAKRKRDKSRYRVNDTDNLKKSQMTRAAFKLYIESHPDADAKSIAQAWNGLGLSDYVQHLVETEEDFKERTKDSKDSNTRATEFELSNGEKIYLSTQFGIDNVGKFIETVNNAGWNIRIEKMSETV